jgi:hypothetical protein
MRWPLVLTSPEEDGTEMDGSTWHLLPGDRIVADLVVYGGDFPWLNARLHPRDGFEEIRPLFEDELGRLDDYDANIEGWEDAYHRVRAEVSLAAPDGHLVPEFILHVHDNEAWWRWSEEPFEDEGPSPNTQRDP